jgi:hypothetical protein
MVNTGIWMGRRLVGWQAVTAVIGVAIVVSALIAASRRGIVRSDLVHAHVLKGFVEESVVFRFYDTEEQKAHDFSISFSTCVYANEFQIIKNRSEWRKKSHALSLTTVSFIPAIVEFHEAWYKIGLKGPALRHRTSRQVDRENGRNGTSSSTVSRLTSLVTEIYITATGKYQLRLPFQNQVSIPF